VEGGFLIEVSLGVVVSQSSGPPLIFADFLFFSCPPPKASPPTLSSVEVGFGKRSMRQLGILLLRHNSARQIFSTLEARSYRLRACPVKDSPNRR